MLSILIFLYGVKNGVVAMRSVFYGVVSYRNGTLFYTVEKEYTNERIQSFNTKRQIIFRQI